jgi:hypothetical protein
MKLYSLHRIYDGRWDIMLHIRRNPDWAYHYEPRPDIKLLVEQNYDLSIDEMARLLLAQVLDCEAVEVSTLSGHGIQMKKSGYDAEAD